MAENTSENPLSKILINRRNFLKIFGLGAVVVATSGNPFATVEAQAEDINIFVKIINETREQYDAAHFLFPVSQTRRLPEDFPKDSAEVPLVTPNIHTGATEMGDTGIKIAQLIQPAVQQLFTEVKKAGLSPKIVSGYRTFAEQNRTFNNYVAAEQPFCKTDAEAEEKANRYSAKAGFSEHHLGLALDIMDGSFAGKPGGQWDEARKNFNQGFYGWLRENSHLSGFALSYPTGADNIQDAKPGCGYPSAEPWHIRFVGRQLAQYLQDNDYLNPQNSVTLNKILLAGEKVK